MHCRRAWALFALLLLAAPAVPAAPQLPPPPGLAQDWEALSALVREYPWNALQWTRGTLVASRLIAAGRSGLPFMQARFADAAAPEQAFLAGVYLAVHGGEQDRAFLRQQLEQNPARRKWLQEEFGSARAVRRTIEEGDEWLPALRLLPSQDGCRKLTAELRRSADPLVRRAGLYWGSLVADAAFREESRRAAREEKDPLARRLAASLIRHAASR